MEMARSTWRMNFTKYSFFVVGLTRIELVTSSLSGMRSNQLSYSPDLKRGLARLLCSFVSLNRNNSHFFFKHRNSHATNEISYQVEDRCQKHPQAGAENYAE